jgi:hypothetical protein
VSVTIGVGNSGLLLAAYNGHPDHGDLLGTATRNAPRGIWTVKVGTTVRRRRRRRSAQRQLVRLALALLIDRALTVSPLRTRREGIAGGVHTWGGAS